MELAYYNGLLVGSIACRVEPKDDDPKTLYILTFNVLKPYRKYKIGKNIHKFPFNPFITKDHSL